MEFDAYINRTSVVNKQRTAALFTQTLPKTSGFIFRKR